jgi:hypothetical protein
MSREKLKWKPRKARVPMQSTWADQLVVVMEFL